MKENYKDKVKYAIPKTLPVMAGYIFLGIAFGITLSEAGYNYVWAFCMSLFVYAGSMQFAMIPLMVGGAAPLEEDDTFIYRSGYCGVHDLDKNFVDICLACVKADIYSLL